jgi:sugar O-acyltransferase (sialic acid O-acetyltransferase NeuD family)
MSATQRRIVLFGVRSPMTADFEEACARAGLTIAAAVKASPQPPRLLDRSPLCEPGTLDAAHLAVRCVVCAFSPIRRRELVAAAMATGLRFDGPLIDPTAIVAASTRVGDGTFVGAGCVVGAAGRIGDHVLVNRAANLGHHAVVDDFATIGPGVTMAGNVRVGEGAVIGAGSTILPGIVIGAGAMVAAGSVVRHDVEADTLVAGAPARRTRLKPSATAVHPPGEE